MRTPKWSPPILGWQYELSLSKSGFLANDLSVFGENPDYVIDILGLVGPRQIRWVVAFIAGASKPGQRLSLESLETTNLRTAIREVERKVRLLHLCTSQALSKRSKVRG